MEGVGYTIIGFVACAILGGVWALVKSLVKKKYTLKDVDASAIEDITKKQTSCRAEVDKKIAEVAGCVNRFNMALPPLLNGVYALLVTTQKGQVDGEIKLALEEFTETFRRDFHIKIER